jgi:hypothetical protein
MASLHRHLTDLEGHDRLPFRADCPRCRARLNGRLQPACLLSPRTEAAAAVGLVAASSLLPTSAALADQGHGLGVPKPNAPPAVIVDDRAARAEVDVPPVKRHANEPPPAPIPKPPSPPREDPPAQLEPAPNPQPTPSPPEDAAPQPKPTPSPHSTSSPPTQDAALQPEPAPSREPTAPAPSAEPAQPGPSPAPAQPAPPRDTQPAPAAAPDVEVRPSNSGNRSRQTAEAPGPRTGASPSAASPPPQRQRSENAPATSSGDRPDRSTETTPSDSSAGETPGRTAAERSTKLAGSRTGGDGDPAPAAAASEPATHVVEPGECLWTIAERQLGRGASDARVAALVDELWRLNADRIGTGDPNLIHGGQELRLP